MRIIKVNRYRVTKRALREAVDVLRAGGVVVHPSESSYGLAVDPKNAAAVRRMFAMKGRKKGKSALVVACSFKQADKAVRLTGKLRILARKHWPGPLTVVAPARGDFYVAGGEKAKDLAIRVPAAAWARALAKEFGGPVTSTSANISGDVAAYTSTAVRHVFRNREFRPDLMLDAGRLPDRPPTTIVRAVGKGIKILRQGQLEITP
ncbi:MAG: L-threonylcarbamoyladenylate synthase [Patescibacteria group bacterium]|nr:L-threonylcarbamoyladenylate synthase [Patescibacteria group bacterium]